MPSRKIEQQLEFLNSLRRCEASDQAILQLRKALGDRVNVVTAKAARISADLELKELLPDLIAAFNRGQGDCPSGAD